MILRIPSFFFLLVFLGDSSSSDACPLQCLCLSQIQVKQEKEPSESQIAKENLKFYQL